MKQYELARHLLDVMIAIDKVVINCASNLNDLFVSDSSNNELVNKEAIVHRAMVDYLIASSINSAWSKGYKSTKTILDATIEALDIPSSGVPGETITLHRSNALKFTKKQNKDGEAVTVTDLLNALARTGVEKDVVDKAFKMALKPRRGNTYYEVTASED